jgi:hypothetical protein
VGSQIRSFLNDLAWWLFLMLKQWAGAITGGVIVALLVALGFYIKQGDVKTQGMPGRLFRRILCPANVVYLSDMIRPGFYRVSLVTRSMDGDAIAQREIYNDCNIIRVVPRVRYEAARLVQWTAAPHIKANELRAD